MSALSICICTYKRPALLNILIQDIDSQSILPGDLIVVDGDPDSGEVKDVLLKADRIKSIVYLPSNHPNLAYQRYLGWRIACESEAHYLLYLDDDLRIRKADALSRLLEPMEKDPRVVGVTADTVTGQIGALASEPILGKSKNRGKWTDKLIEIFGSGRNIPPGGLTPSGHRRIPLRHAEGFTEVQWLQGRVMLYRMSALTSECFSKDLFALDHIRCDLGEDTYLSRQVGAKGTLLFGFDLGLDHPNADLPKCYPIEAEKFGYARAYSRRFLNDHYRVTHSPHLSDRLALFKSYVGNTLLNWMRVISSHEDNDAAYARGYTMGALRGIFQKPTARNLTPEIDWWEDAEKALAQAVVIQ